MPVSRSLPGTREVNLAIPTAQYVLYWFHNQSMDRVTQSIPDRPKAISVGVIVGGVTAESKVWRETVTRLSRDLSGIAGQLESDFRINFEFQVPGHITSPDFQGVRTGTFRKADRHLKIQIAVPNDPPGDPYAYCVHSIGDAVDAAEAWSVRRRIEFDAAPFRAVLALLNENPSQSQQSRSE